jgi:Protein of unknown function (DUF3179)
MHVSQRVCGWFWCALLPVFASCEFSDTNVDESRIDRVLITDQSGKTWDITQAVVRYGFDPAGFKFGLGPFTVTPLVLPPAVAAGDSGFPADTDTFSVIGVSLAGAARAYQLDDLLDVEVADDIVGGEVVAVIHRPLVGEPSVCARVLAGDTLTISASGWVYDNESVLFDYQTESMWYRLGADGTLTCIAGAHFQSVLPGVPSTVARWNTWRASHPSTRFMLR